MEAKTIKIHIQKQGDNVALIIVPLSGKFTLSELLKKVTPENIHTEADTTPAVGREFW